MTDVNGFYTSVVQIGNKIYHRWVDDVGTRRDELTDFKPDMFMVSKGAESFKGIRGEPLDKIEFGGIGDAKSFINEYKGISNLKLHGNQNWWAQFITQRYTADVGWDYDSLVILNFDIETKINDRKIDTENTPNEITAIALEVKGKYTVYGSKDYTNKVLPLDAEYVWCENEKELLYLFVKHWQNLAPDIVTGWNIKFFDIPYIINRIALILGDDYSRRLSPMFNYTKRCINRREHETGVDYTINGLAILDMLELYKKFTYKNQEKFSLDHIAYVELGEKKLDYSEYGNLDDLWENDYNKYIDYNVKDVELVRRINEKLNLLRLAATLAYLCKIRLDDVFSQVKMWDTIIYNRLLSMGIVIPPKTGGFKADQYRGAIVFEPQIGLHHWILSEDLDSLYPHLIQMFNISPEELLEYKDIEKLQRMDVDRHELYETILCDMDLKSRVNLDIDKLVAGKSNDVLDAIRTLGLTVAANGVIFKRGMGFLPKIMEEMYAQRKQVKRNMLDTDSEIELIKAEIELRGIKL